jgi:hypothetical protein
LNKKYKNGTRAKSYRFDQLKASAKAALLPSVSIMIKQKIKAGQKAGKIGVVRPKINMMQV